LANALKRDSFSENVNEIFMPVKFHDCQARKLNTEDAMDRSKWRKSIKDVR